MSSQKRIAYILRLHFIRLVSLSRLLLARNKAANINWFVFVVIWLCPLFCANWFFFTFRVLSRYAFQWTSEYVLCENEWSFLKMVISYHGLAISTLRVDWMNLTKLILLEERMLFQTTDLLTIYGKTKKNRISWWIRLKFPNGFSDIFIYKQIECSFSDNWNNDAEMNSCSQNDEF